METRSRRHFLEAAGAALVTGSWQSTAAHAQGSAPASRRFTQDLVCGAIGIRVPQREAVELAARHGFESVGAHGADLQAMSDAELSALGDLMAEKKLRWGAANLPTDFRKDDETFRTTNARLADFAKAMRRAGVARVGTWLSPSSDTLTYRQNFETVSSRLREVAGILTGEGLRLGLEYVGPKTAWSGKRYPFLHTMAETRELIEAIGAKGVGLVLDSWHWYLAGDTVADIGALRNEDVVAVDLNDAPAGLGKDHQVDSARELPVATGVIPVRDFLDALVAIGYDGPVRAEPFNKALNALPKEEAVAATAASMRKALALLEAPS
jgi:sugar phosphate isomerase/epimerase